MVSLRTTIAIIATFLLATSGWCANAWQGSHFQSLWGMEMIPDVSTMSLIQAEPSEVAPQTLTVAMRLGSSDFGGSYPNAGWDAFGELSNFLLQPIPHYLSFTHFEVTDPDSFSIDIEEMWIAGTLTGPGGEIHVSGLVALVEIQELASGGDSYANVYFLPTQVWGDITDAHDAVQSLHLSTPSFVEVLGSDSQQAIGIQIPTTETVSDCTDQWDADRRACDDDLDDDLRDCYDDAEFAENLCKNSRRTSELAADVRLATCLNNVGLLDRLGAACTAGGGGVIVGGGIGFIFKGIGAVPGGIIGGCAGFVGGFIGGAAVARAECRKDHDTDYKVAAALFDDCMDRAWDDYIDCRADADDAWEDCRAAAEAAYTRCLENATIIP